MNRIEMEAADALLDRRLRVDIPAPSLFRLFGKQTVSIWPKRPVGASLIRISRLFAEMDIDADELMSGKFGTLLEYIGRHGKTASRLIAYGLIRGPFASWLFNRPLAWYLRNHMTLSGMADLMKLIVLLSDAEFFVDIIRSAKDMTLTKPTLSQPTGKGS